MKRMLGSAVLVLLVACSGEVRESHTENIILITFDGLRWQEVFTGADSTLVHSEDYVHDIPSLEQKFWVETPDMRRQKLLPFFWSTIAREGQLYGNRLVGNFVNCTNTMWFSYPGYNEILCGFADDERINSNDKTNNPNVTFLEYLSDLPDYKGKVAAFGSWDVFPYIINRERSGIPVNAGFELAEGNRLTEREEFLNELQPQIPSPWSSVRLDAFTHQYAMEYIRKNKPRVVYIAYGETDDFAHDGRYDAYLKSAHQTDKFIEEIWNYLQSSPVYRNKTTLLITTDHGRGTLPLASWRNHGRDVEGAGEIWFAVIGPDTEAKGEVREPMQLHQSQLAKTAAAFLGVDYKNERPVGEVARTMIKNNK